MTMILKVILLAASLSACFGAALPTILLNPVVPVITGTDYTVCSSMCSFTTLQAAVNAATCGDGITITAGQTFVGTTTLPNLGCTGSVLIRSSAYASLPATGNRAGSPDAANMPLLKVTTDNTPVITNDYTNVVPSARAAHGYYFLGLNVTLGSAVTTNYGLFNFDDGANLAGVVNNITIDRCWIHSDHVAMGTDNFVRGIFFAGGAYVAIINSTVEGFASRAAGVGADSQSMAITGGPGPGLIRNNYLNASSEILAFGGSWDGVMGNQVADWEIAFNYLDKDITYATTGWVAKDGLEFKTGVRMWTHDNLIEHTYNTADQVGAGLVLTTRPSQDGGLTESDITVQGNVFRHIGEAFQSQAKDNTCVGTCPTQSNEVIQNNLFEDIDQAYSPGDPSPVQESLVYADTVAVDHNTFIPGASMPPLIAYYFFYNMGLSTPIWSNLAFTKNIAIAPSGAYADGFATNLQDFLVPPYTGGYVIWTGNLMSGIDSTQQTKWNVVGSSNQFPANYAAIGLLSDNKSLSTMSAYFSTGAGANLEACFAETAIRAGTLAPTSCIKTGTIVVGKATIGGKLVIH